MNKINKKTLPKGFRHLFSHREIKGLEAQLAIRFDHISFGHIIHTGTFQKGESQTMIHSVSISGHQRETEWLFSIHQSGFREELLPSELERETKEKVGRLISEYISKILSSKETDFIHYPQLWVYTRIINYKLEVRTKELK